MSSVCVVKTIKELQDQLKGLENIGFVPTMGALHEGHARLIKESRKKNQFTVVSLFVNPLQFNNVEDLKTYPNTFEKDLKFLEDLKVDFLFIPDKFEIYPEGDSIKVTDFLNSQIIEGEKRPGHFDGVLTVVLKLFNIVKPRRAYFGEKDFQQLSLIRSMTKSLFLEVEVVGVKTVRDEKGLPFSSRNQKLSPKGLKQAQEAASAFEVSKSREDFLVKIKNIDDVELDYVEEKWGRLLTVYKVDGVRILDNRELVK